MATYSDSFRDGELFYRVCTITTASPAVITRRLHGLEENDRVQFYASGALPTGLSTETWYYVIAAGFSNDSFEIATTKGGTAVNATVAGSGTYYFAPEAASRMLPSQE